MGRPKEGGGGTAVHDLRSRTIYDLNARTRQRAAAFPPRHLDDRVVGAQRRGPYVGPREDYIAPSNPGTDCDSNEQLKAALAAGTAAKVLEDPERAKKSEGNVYSLHAWRGQAEYHCDLQRYIVEELAARPVSSSTASGAAAAYMEMARRCGETVPFKYAPVPEDTVIVGSNDGPVRIINRTTGKLLVATIKVCRLFSYSNAGIVLILVFVSKPQISQRALRNGKWPMG